MLWGGGSICSQLLRLGLVLIGAGVWIYLPTQNATEQEKLNIAHVQNGVEPKSNWVKVQGKMAWEETVVIENRYGGEEGFVVPVVPSDWESGDPLKVFAYISARGDVYDSMEDYTTIEGLIRPLGMPLDVRMVLSDSNVAESPIYIEHGSDPSSQRKFALTIIGIGLLLAGGGAAPFVLPMLGGNSSDDYRKAKPDPEAISRRAQREVQCDNDVNEWLMSRGLATPSKEPNELVEV